MLSEESTKGKAIDEDAQGFDENKEAAQKGGKAAGHARIAYEKETRKKVSTKQNFKKQIAEAKKKNKLKGKKES